MSCPSIGVLGQNLVFTVQTTAASGAAVDADSVPTYSVYESSTDTELTSGSMSKLDDDNTAGFYSGTAVISTASGYEQYKSYNIRVVATISGTIIPTVYSFICLGSAAASSIAGGSSGTAWSLTKAEITRNIETLLRNIRGGKSIVTYNEKLIISDAINAGMMDICMDSGISRWRWLLSNETVATVADQAYVDLTANVFNLISGTVRIPSENTRLTKVTPEMIYKLDPEQDTTGIPTIYAFESSDDPETVRLMLWPIPDAVYNLSYKAEKIIDEDSVASFPAWMHSMLKDKSTSNSLRDLGHFLEAREFNASYLGRRSDAKASQGGDGPITINRVSGSGNERSIHDRKP